jgi:hypothetical protein
MLHYKLQKSLELFVPIGCQQAVKELASSLSVDQGCKDAELLIRSVIENVIGNFEAARNKEAKRKDANAKFGAVVGVEAKDESKGFETLVELSFTKHN